MDDNKVSGSATAGTSAVNLGLVADVSQGVPASASRQAQPLSAAAVRILRICSDSLAAMPEQLVAQSTIAFKTVLMTAGDVVTAGTLRCTEENEAFRLHYRQMEQAFQQPVSQRQQQLEQQLAEHRWRPHEEQQEQHEQQKRWWKPW